MALGIFLNLWHYAAGATAISMLIYFKEEVVANKELLSDTHI